MLLRLSPLLRAPATPAGWSSKYGPSMKSQLQFGGLPLLNLRRYTTMTAGFGAAALLAVAFLMEDVPVVRKDIYQNLPIIGHYWDRTVAPEDNPF